MSGVTRSFLGLIAAPYPLGYLKSNDKEDADIHCAHYEGRGAGVAQVLIEAPRASLRGEMYLSTARVEESPQRANMRQ